MTLRRLLLLSALCFPMLAFPCSPFTLSCKPIHTTCVVAPGGGVSATAVMNIGSNATGTCVIQQSINMGARTFNNNDLLYVDGDDIKRVFGPEFSCAEVVYTTLTGKVATDSFTIHWDKSVNNYTLSVPAHSEINLT